MLWKTLGGATLISIAASFLQAAPTAPADSVGVNGIPVMPAIQIVAPKSSLNAAAVLEELIAIFRIKLQLLESSGAPADREILEQTQAALKVLGNSESDGHRSVWFWLSLVAAFCTSGLLIVAYLIVRAAGAADVMAPKVATRRTLRSTARA